MKKYLSITLVTLLLTGILFSCKKSTPFTPITPQATCVIKTETTNLSGKEKSFEYQYDNKGNLTLVNVFNRAGGSAGMYDTYDQGVIFSHEYLGKTNKSITKYETSDIYTLLPNKAYVSLQDGDTLRVNYYTYFFFYNNKNQLIKVGEQTDYVIGDWEYDLNIFYNEQGNVSGLQYERTTGPNQVIPPIIVTAWDDKPTPYAAVKGWPYFMINFAWDNYDPEPIITALSKNNPLNYSFGTGTNLFTREMVYTYNNDGFPTERKNTNKNTNGEYTFLQTFSYNCK